MTERKPRKTKELKPLSPSDAKEMIRSVMAYLSVSGFVVKYGMAGDALVVKIYGIDLNENTTMATDDAKEIPVMAEQSPEPTIMA